jgi:hypothetical protein
MNDTEMIAMQARKIIEMEAEIAQQKDQLHRIRMQLICCGAPLNDNFLKYSKEQLEPFGKIQDILNGCVD